MPRIKITGYIDTEDLDPEDLDPSNPTGLSEKGFMKITTYEGRMPLADLEDMELESDEDDDL